MNQGVCRLPWTTPEQGHLSKSQEQDKMTPIPDTLWIAILQGASPPGMHTFMQFLPSLNWDYLCDQYCTVLYSRGDV